MLGIIDILSNFVLSSRRSFVPLWQYDAFFENARISLVNFSLLHITCKDSEEAKTIGRILVEEKLAACINILKDVHSIYRWKGKIEEAEEAVLLAKTRADLVPKLIERVKELHSYDCPCVVALPITEGNEEYLEWVRGACG